MTCIQQFTIILCVLCFVCAVEPQDKGHIGASQLVLCREVVCSSEVQNVLTICENEHLGL